MKLRTALFAFLAVLPVGLQAGATDGAAVAPMDGSTYVPGKVSSGGLGTNSQDIVSSALNGTSTGGYGSGLGTTSAGNPSLSTSSTTSDPTSSNTISNSSSSSTTATEDALENSTATSTGATDNDIGTPKGYSHRSADPNDHSVEIGRGTEKMIDTGDKDFRTIVQTAPSDKRFSSSLLDIGLPQNGVAQTDKDQSNLKAEKADKPVKKVKDAALKDDDQRFKKFVPTTDDTESNGESKDKK